MIFLTGMPGSGKTYWGRKVAETYYLPWADTDIEFERKNGVSISHYFQEHGEAAFREEESKVLAIIIARVLPNAVVSCGGGTVLQNENRQMMKAFGCIIYLEAGIEILAERLAADSSRPMLQGADKRAVLTTLLEQRSEYYQQADYTLNTDSLQVNQFETIIHQCIKQH
jgi:shikimate kinase